MVEDAYVGAGSDLGDRLSHLLRGVEGLRAAGVAPLEVSSVWVTEGVDTPEPARFLNVALRLRTELGPRQLLDRLLEIEQDLGRVRRVPNGPRTLDLDLLLVGQRVVDVPGLSLPHPRMWQRRFVLAPLCEIAPALRNPRSGRTVREELESLPPGPAVRRLSALARPGAVSL